MRLRRHDASTWVESWRDMGRRRYRDPMSGVKRHTRHTGRQECVTASQRCQAEESPYLSSRAEVWTCMHANLLSMEEMEG